MVAEVSIVMTKLKKIILTILKVIAVIFTVGFIPVLLYFLFSKKVTPGEWLGFFGTYFGSAISIGFAYINTRYQFKEKYEKEATDNLYKLLKKNKSLLNSLYDMQEKLKMLIEEETRIGIGIGTRVTDFELPDMISTAMSQIEIFLEEFPFVMNQLTRIENEHIMSKYDNWYKGYSSIDFLKSYSKQRQDYRYDTDNFSYNFIKKAHYCLANFIDESVELESALSTIYKERSRLYY